jgi:hypothetical protein
MGAAVEALPRWTVKTGHFVDSQNRPFLAGVATA